VLFVRTFVGVVPFHQVMSESKKVDSKRKHLIYLCVSLEGRKVRKSNFLRQTQQNGINVAKLYIEKVVTQSKFDKQT
jgi:hypothetical protein